MRRWRRVEKLVLLILLFAVGALVFPALRLYHPAEPEPIYFVPGEPSKVAFTFETLWSSSGLDETLALLEKENMQATFFITGDWLKQNPAAAAEIINKGHEIGNHAISSKNMLYLDQKEIDGQISGFNELSMETLEYVPRLFRPPLGLYNGLILSMARSNRCLTILWSVDSYDTISSDAGEIVERVMGRMHGGAIVSFRIGSPHLTEALQLLIEQMREQGYEVVTVTHLLEAGG